MEQIWRNIRADRWAMYSPAQLEKKLHRCLKVDITNSLVLQFEGSTPSTKNPVNGRHPVPVSSPPQKKKKKKKFMP